MSEINIQTTEEDILDDEQTEEFELVNEIENEIIEHALVTVESHERHRSSENLIQTILDDILNNVCEVKSQFRLPSFSSLSSSLSSDSEASSESSYHVPSYLQLRCERAVSEKIATEEEREHTCEQYEEIDKYAEVVVDEILNKAIEITFRRKREIPEDSNLSEKSTETTTSTTVEWPSIETFTVELGIKKIYEFMDTWDFEEDWLYCVDFLTQLSDECSDYYKYEAQWSIPTQMYPIPQATARIFFTIECSRVKPSHCPVNVTYIYEGTSFVHTLESIFSEDRLFEIVDAKLKFYQRLTF